MEKRTYNWKCKIPENIRKINDLFKESGCEIYLVGGCVRDMLLGRVPDDYDFCCSATPKEMAELLKKNQIEYDDSGSIVGYVIAMLDGEKIDLVKYKGENLEEDLRARDFTMNAMAYDIERQEIIDYQGGKEDIEKREIRCCDKAIIRENPRMIFRALRFAIEFDFRIEKETYCEMERQVEALDHIRISALKKDTRKLLKYGERVFLPE